MVVLINVKELKFDSFSRRQQHPFRLNRRVAAASVDTALTRAESKNRKQLRINYLRFLGVPRTGLEPARLSARAPETRASTIPPPGHRVLVVQSYDIFFIKQT